MENNESGSNVSQSFFQKYHASLSRVFISGCWPEILKHLSETSDISDEYFMSFSEDEQVFLRAIGQHEKNKKMSIYECILRDMIGAIELEKTLDGCRRRVAKNFGHSSSMSEYDTYIHLLEEEIQQQYHRSKKSSK